MATPHTSHDDLLGSLQRDLDDEIYQLAELVGDDDTAGPARSLRQERLAAIQYVRRLLDQYDRWDWHTPDAGLDEPSSTPTS